MINSEETPWSEAVVLVCTKCHQAIASDTLKEPGNAGENLKGYLKSKLKAAGRGHEVRVVTSSCLDVCLAGKQAVTLSPVRPSTKATRTWTVDPEKDRDSLLEEIIKSI